MTNIWTPPGQYSIDPNPFGQFPAPILYIPFDDIGYGEVDIRPRISYDIITTFTRATVAWTRTNESILPGGTAAWRKVAAGVPRSYWINPSTQRGFLHEPVRTNTMLWNRDYSNPVWVKTNVTVVKDQTGIDNVANSAWTLTATANNATIAQTVTQAAMNSGNGPWLKRLIGTGTIEISYNGGATWIAAAPSSTWNGPFGSTSIATGLNPTIVLRFATAGDSVGIDFWGIEDVTLGGMTSIIETQGVPVTRDRDLLTYTGVLLPTPAEYTFAAGHTKPFSNGNTLASFSISNDNLNFTQFGYINNASLTEIINNITTLIIFNTGSISILSYNRLTASRSSTKGAYLFRQFAIRGTGASATKLPPLGAPWPILPTSVLTMGETGPLSAGQAPGIIIIKNLQIFNQALDFSQMSTNPYHPIIGSYR